VSNTILANFPFVFVRYQPGHTNVIDTLSQRPTGWLLSLSCPMNSPVITRIDPSVQLQARPTFYTLPPTGVPLYPLADLPDVSAAHAMSLKGALL
jgi:hypothetical protein